jgi:hypothetical protein
VVDAQSAAALTRVCHEQTAKMMEAPPISNLARPFWLIKVRSRTCVSAWARRHGPYRSIMLLAAGAQHDHHDGRVHYAEAVHFSHSLVRSTKPLHSCVLSTVPLILSIAYVVECVHVHRSQQGAKFTAVQQKIAALQVRKHSITKSVVSAEC